MSSLDGTDFSLFLFLYILHTSIYKLHIAGVTRKATLQIYLYLIKFVERTLGTNLAKRNNIKIYIVLFQRFCGLTFRYR